MVIINYLFIGALLVMSLVFALLPILVEAIFAPKKKGTSKSQTYECGVLTTGETWIRFRIQYFIYAIMFVVFDIETVFLYPWAVSYAGFGHVCLLRDGCVSDRAFGWFGLRVGNWGVEVALSRGFQGGRVVAADLRVQSRTRSFSQ